MTAKTLGHVDNVRVANYASLPMANIGAPTPTGEMKIGGFIYRGHLRWVSRKPYIKLYTRAYVGRMGEKRRCASVVAKLGVVQYDGVRFCDLRKIGKIWIKCSKKEKIATANVKKM